MPRSLVSGAQGNNLTISSDHWDERRHADETGFAAEQTATQHKEARRIACSWPCSVCRRGGYPCLGSAGCTSSKCHSARTLYWCLQARVSRALLLPAYPLVGEPPDDGRYITPDMGCGPVYTDREGPMARPHERRLHSCKPSTNKETTGRKTNNQRSPPGRPSRGEASALPNDVELPQKWLMLGWGRWIW